MSDHSANHGRSTLITLPILCLLCLSMILVGCGSTVADGALEITNGDPQAEGNLTTITVYPPEGWALTGTGNGITDGTLVINALSLSDI
ncbi:MAG: hypothetical protein AAF125_22155, partial [Chloroflexota bacterium]